MAVSLPLAQAPPPVMPTSQDDSNSAPESMQPLATSKSQGSAATYAATLPPNVARVFTGLLHQEAAVPFKDRQPKP